MNTGQTEPTDAFVAAYPELRPFWDAAAERRLVLKFCDACGRTHWYPRLVCPHCHGDAFHWKDASGRATVYSFSVIRTVEEPFVLAYVQLEEGPIMMTNIVDCGVEEVHIGQSVQVQFQPVAPDRWAPFFAPMTDRAAPG